MENEMIVPEPQDIEPQTTEIAEEPMLVIEEPEVKPEPEIVEPVVETKTKKKDALVALYSDRKILWDGVGRLVRGINYVTKAEADKWIVEKSYVKIVKETDK